MASQLNIEPCWKYYTSFASGLVNACKDCPDVPFVSLLVPTAADWGEEPNTKLIVRRIVFTTVSHDQGWTGSDRIDCHGTYENSHSLFDARVLESSGHERVRRKRLQYNLLARKEFKTHVSCWDYRDDRYTAWLGSIQEETRSKLYLKLSILDGIIMFEKPALTFGQRLLLHPNLPSRYKHRMTILHTRSCNMARKRYVFWQLSQALATMKNRSGYPYELHHWLIRTIFLMMLYRIVGERTTTLERSSWQILSGLNHQPRFLSIATSLLH